MKGLLKNLPVLLLVIVCAFTTITCSNVKSLIEPFKDEIFGIDEDPPGI